MLNIFSAARSLSGIYRELRTLRRMAESWFEFAGIPLPQTPYERLKKKVLGSESDQNVELAQPELSEDERVQEEANRIVADLAAGRDPGTDWRPW